MHDAPLYVGKIRDVSLNAKVAPSDHNAISGANDIVNMRDAFLILDFGDDFDGVCFTAEEGAAGLNVGSLSNKR